MRLCNVYHSKGRNMTGKLFFSSGTNRLSTRYYSRRAQRKKSLKNLRLFCNPRETFPFQACSNKYSVTCLSAISHHAPGTKSFVSVQCIGLPGPRMHGCAGDSFTGEDSVYPGVELRLYRYVAAIADELNFTHAAEKLHVAQPALSRQIAKLERYLGFALFERDHRGVRLTVAGEAFVVEARLTLFHAQRAIEGARAAKGQHKGPWKLGYSPLIDLRIPAKIRQHLSLAHPAADFRLVSAHTSEQVDGLIRGKLQAGLVIPPIREQGLTFEGLYKQGLVLALPEHHPLVSKIAVEVTDLEGLSLVLIRGDIEPRFGDYLRHILEVARVRPRVFHEATTQAEALEIVSEGTVAALTMPSAQYPARERVVFREFSDDFLTVEVGLAFLGENRSAILTSLRKFLLETFQPLSGGGFRDGRARQMALF